MKTAAFTPNSILPLGATLLPKPRILEIGAWKPLKYDAKLVYKTITWYRVCGGMSEYHNREDWCADVPSVCISIHDYHWNGESFGINYGSMDKAMDGEIKSALSHALRKAQETKASLECLHQAIGIITDSQSTR